MKLKEFKNNNIHLKLDNGEEVKGFYDAIQFLNNSEEFFWNDLRFVGEEFCISNWEVAILIYNDRLGVAYEFGSYDAKQLAKGKTIKLVAYEMESDE